MKNGMPARISNNKKEKEEYAHLSLSIIKNYMFFRS